MKIHQFEDKNLSQYAYAIVSKGEMALIDPARDPEPYYTLAEEAGAKIVAIIETHPHADFVSSHREISRTTGAPVYVSRLLGAEYPHHGFDEGDGIKIGDVWLWALNTPGHSPDSISILAADDKGKQKAVFTGDTLFIGDCGRPDLREQAGAITASREDLARQMYHSLREKLMALPDDVLVYPAHGAGSLCGKGLSAESVSTIGAEKLANWSLQDMSEEAFVRALLADQPFIPKYFPFDVSINKTGAGNYAASMAAVPRVETKEAQQAEKLLDPSVLIIDTRPQDKFKQSHLPNAINLMNDTRFETWLGSIVSPAEPFYLVADSAQALEELISRIAKIGYEKQIALALADTAGTTAMPFFDSQELRDNESAYTIVDIRNESEVKDNKIFANALHIPLHELRERIGEIPLNKPIVVHCAGGYRSAAGSSLIRAALQNRVPVYDLSTDVKTFQL